MYSTNDSRKAALAEFYAAKAALARAEAHLAELDNPYGKDDFPEGTVLRFQMRYNGFGSKYTFAVIKAGGLWYPTGLLGQDGTRNRNWEQLCSDWKTYNVKPENIDVLTTRESLAMHNEPF